MTDEGMTSGASGDGQPRSPDIAVVIPCFNGAATLGAQLELLQSQHTGAAFEIVVADNGSTDDSAAIARAADRADVPVRVIDASSVAGINHARNAGIAGSTAPFIVFCDVDDRVHPGWLEAYWAAFSSGARLAGGHVRRVFADGSPALDWAEGLNDHLKFLKWPTGANCAVAREVIAACGDFDESFRGGGDEVEFYWRAQLAGFELVFVRDAVIDYVQRPSSDSLYRQQYLYGRSHVKLYSLFATAGMPRLQRLSSIRDLIEGVARVALSRAGSRRRQHGVRLIALAVGHIRGSIALRVAYF